MTRNELPAQAANVKQAVESWATCTSATAESLRTFLLPAKPVVCHEKVSSSASQRLKTKPLKAQGTREAKKSKKTLGAKVLEGSEKESAAFHIQDRWILATAVANAALRALTDSMKNAPVKKVDCGRVSNEPLSGSVSRPDSKEMDNAVPLQPISANRLSAGPEKPRRSRRSSSESTSNQRQGLRAQAECARIAFAALRSMHLHDGLGADMPPLQLETGMSALIGKLIAVGFDDLALKELRILKKRLDRMIGISAARGPDLMTAKKTQAEDAPATSKESLDGLLAFEVPIDRGSLLALVITCQLQALKLIYTLGNAATIDASLKHLQLCYPCSPANLIDLQMDKTSKENKIKSARQLELLSQSLLALSSNLSTVPEGKGAGLRQCPSPTTVFELKIAVLEIRLRRWILLAHKPNMTKDIIEPFALYLDTLHRQPSLTPLEKYSNSRIAHQRLSTAAETLPSIPPEQLWLPLYTRLADLAQESSRSDEALQWLQCAMKSFPKKEIGSCKYCAVCCRITNVRLGTRVDSSDGGDLLVALKDAQESLKGNLRGEPADFDDLLTVIFILRRSAFSALHGYRNSPANSERTSRPGWLEIVHLCSDLILLSLKFLVRYVGSVSKVEKTGSLYTHQMQMQMQMIWNNARLFVESIAAMTRSSVATQMHNWETLEIGLQDCAWLFSTLSELRSIESHSWFGQEDLKELSIIPISNAYWCRYLYLKQKGGSSQELRKSLHIAIELLASRPTEEKLTGLLPAKLEKSGLLYEASKEYAKATRTYAEALQLLVQGNMLEAAVAKCAKVPLAEVLETATEYSILGRLLLSYVRVASKTDSFVTEAARLYFDDESLPSAERGLMLEQQLIALSSIIHKQGLSPTICKSLLGTSASLLTVYETSEFPVRRLRVVVCLLQLRSSHPTAIDVNVAEQILKYQWNSAASIESLESDTGLHRFAAHLLQCRDLYMACLETTINLQLLDDTLALWSTMLQDAATWNSIRTQVNDVAHWILQLEFLAEYLEMQGLDLLRIRALQLIATLQDLRQPVDSPAVLCSFSILASACARLGYATRATDALQVAMKYGDAGASPETIVGWNLACAEVALDRGNIARAQEHCTEARSIFTRTAQDKDAQSSSFRKAIKTIHLMSDINHISSLLAMKKNDFPKAFLHARLNLKLGYRAWSAIESSHNNNTNSNKSMNAAGDGKLIRDELLLSEIDGDTDADADADADDHIANKMSALSLATKPNSPPISPSSSPSSSSSLLQQNIPLPLWSTTRRLFHALVHLSHLFAHWGLFPEARYYIEQALKIVEAAPAPAPAQGPSCLKIQALVCLGGYFVRNGNAGDVEKGMDILRRAEDLVGRYDVRQADHHLVALLLCKVKYFMLHHKKDIKSVDDALVQASKVLEQLLTIDPPAVVNQPLSTISILKPTNAALAHEDLSAEMMSKLTLQHDDVPSSSLSSSPPTTHRRLQNQTQTQTQTKARARVTRTKNGAGRGAGAGKSSSSSSLVTSTGAAKATTATVTATISRGGSTTVSPFSSSAGAGAGAGATATVGTSSIYSRIKATILRNQASVATSTDHFDVAASFLAEAGTILDIPHEDQVILNQIAAGKFHLRQAVDAMAADPVFCVLPESTTSLPSVCVVSSVGAGRGGRQGGGVSASERSPMRKKKALGGSPARSAAAAAVKGRDAVSRDTTTMTTTTTTRIMVGGGHAASQTGLRFSEYLAQAHGDILSVYEHALKACSTTDVHNMMDLLTKTNVMLSASADSQAKAATNTMFILYVMELGKMLSMVRANSAVQVEQQFSTHRPPLDWPARDTGDGGVLSASTTEPTFDFSAFQSLYIDIIPPSWTVLSISLSESQDEIRVARVRSGQTPFILSLPLRRHNFRDPEEECFGFKSARDELEEIVNLANFSAHDAQDMTRKGARSEWWEVRHALDARLRDLLVNIENVWLGGFRGIFSRHEYRPELLARFQQSLQNILNKHLPSRQKQGRGKVPGRVALDPRVLELFIGLEVPDELDELDEQLMDLLYFVIDILQFHGERNAYDEIDFDSISIEIIDALRHYHKAVRDEVRDDQKSKHTILILDKTLHCFPWESLPCLKEHAVSRLPSLACLRDRILQQQKQAREQSREQSREQGRWNNDGLHVARRGGAAILNPTADLKATQAVFEPALAQLHDWDIVIQRPPGEEEMKACLEKHDVFLYFGHGSGAQYIRSRTIRKLEKCAVTLLMGCSSGALTEAGEFEPYGTPISYIQGGCPALVANLWDVTDKDIDQFSIGVLNSWGLFQPKKQQQQDNQNKAFAATTALSPIKRSTRHRAARNDHNNPQGGSQNGEPHQQHDLALAPPVAVSLDQAVAQSRDLCKMRYLNGAAPVAYGVPVFLV